MAVQLSISYKDLVTLVDQLSPEERQDLVKHLLSRPSHRRLTDEEWRAAFEAMKITSPLAGPVSLRREDWYGDDER